MISTGCRKVKCECRFVVWQMTLAECMPHLLSFGALSPRTAQIH